MPNVPTHLDIPRFATARQNLDEWVSTLHRTLQRQWTMMTQAYNALLKVDTAANRPSVPYLDEILFYEQDTGRSYIAVSGNWQHLSPWSGRTVSVAVAYTMQGNDAITLVNATSAAVSITVNNGSSYGSRIRSVKKTDSSLNTVYIVPSSGSIEGGASYNLPRQYDSAVFTSDGTDLWLVGGV